MSLLGRRFQWGAVRGGRLRPHMLAGVALVGLLLVAQPMAFTLATGVQQPAAPTIDAFKALLDADRTLVDDAAVVGAQINARKVPADADLVDLSTQALSSLLDIADWLNTTATEVNNRLTSLAQSGKLGALAGQRERLNASAAQLQRAYAALQKAVSAPEASPSAANRLPEFLSPAAVVVRTRFEVPQRGHAPGTFQPGLFNRRGVAAGPIYTVAGNLGAAVQTYGSTMAAISNISIDNQPWQLAVPCSGCLVNLGADLPVQVARVPVALNVMRVPYEVSVNPTAVPSSIDELRRLLQNLENLVQQGPQPPRPIQAKPLPRGHGSALGPLLAVGTGLAIGGVILAHEQASMNSSCDGTYVGSDSGTFTSGPFAGRSTGGSFQFTVSGGAVTLTGGLSGSGSVSSCSSITFSVNDASTAGTATFQGTISGSVASGTWTDVQSNPAGSAQGTWSATRQ